VAAAADDGISTRGFIGLVVALTLVAYGAIALAAKSLNGRDERIVAFVCGIAAVVLAVMMTFFGGFAIAPALATIPLAASARAGGGWYRGRAVASVAILAATLAWYIAIVADDADF
jgi:hypothetical protein